MSTKKGGNGVSTARQADAGRKPPNSKAGLLPAKSRWQLVCSGLLLGLWVAFLTWIATKG